MTTDIAKLMHDKYVRSSLDPAETRSDTSGYKAEHRFFEMGRDELHAVTNHLAAHYLESDVYVTPQLSRDTHDGMGVTVLSFAFTQHDYRKVEAIVRGLEDIYRPEPLDSVIAAKSTAAGATRKAGGHAPRMS